MSTQTSALAFMLSLLWKPPEPLESKPKPVQDPKLQVQVVPQPPQPTSKPVDPKLVQFQDTFRERLFQALAADGSYDGLESFVSKSFKDPDPQTSEAFTHDTWVELPTMWIRLHRLLRATLFAPSEQLQGGPLLSDLSGVRVTITLDDYHGMAIQEDTWTADGETSSACEMIRGAICFEKKDLDVHEVPEVADPDESSARRPKGLPAPGEPTLTERREHELTHLPFRSWCVRAKSKQSSQSFNLATLSLVTTVRILRSHLLRLLICFLVWDFRALFLAEVVRCMLRLNFGVLCLRHAVLLAYFRLIPSLP